MARPRTDAVVRFSENWMPEPFSGCWLWFGYTKPTGYGTISVNRKMLRSHRFSWMLHRGEIPNGLHVLHTCDTPSCVNPDHLFLGTHTENIKDRDRKRRNTRGVTHPKAKLSEDDVRELRKMRQQGMSYRKLADFFHLNRKTAYYAANGKTWRDVS